VRGVGPTLSDFGVEGVLARPVLSLLRGGEVIALNEGWTTAPNASEIRGVSALLGAFALGDDSTDSALFITLTSGVYTVHVAGANETTGVALAEIYEAP